MTDVDGDALVPVDPFVVSRTLALFVPLSSTAYADAWLFADAVPDIVMVIVLSPPPVLFPSEANCSLDRFAVCVGDPCSVRLLSPEHATVDTVANADCHAMPTTIDRPAVVPVSVSVNELLPEVIPPVTGPTVTAMATRL